MEGKTWGGQAEKFLDIDETSFYYIIMKFTLRESWVHLAIGFIS
jgi:hypothetical protein